MGNENESEATLDEAKRILIDEDFKHCDSNNRFHTALKCDCDLKMRSDREYATDVYRALCNMRWRVVGFVGFGWKSYIKAVFFGRKSGLLYSCSWRYAGGLVAEIRNFGEDYLDFYCSGGEGRITREVKRDFKRMGFVPFKFDHWSEKIRRYMNRRFFE